MKTVLIFICTIVLTISVNAQFTILDNIGSGLNSGLGFNFQGMLNNNGKLYFSGSSNQFNFTIYETDGSSSGTKRAVSSSAINNSDGIFYSDDKIYIKDFDGGVKLKVFDPASGDVDVVNFFNGVGFSDVHFMGDRVLVSGSSNKIYTTDGTTVGSVELTDLSGSSFNKNVTTNDSIAIIEDSGFSPNFEPTIVYNNGQNATELVDYLKPIIQLERVRSAAVIEELCLIQDVQDGIVENSIFNFNTRAYAPFEFFGGYIDGFRLGDKIIAISRNNVFAINPDDFSFESLVSNDVFAFTTVTRTEDKFYFIAQGSSSFQYFESDGTLTGTRALAGTDVSTSSFNPRQAIRDGILYYIIDSGTSNNKILMAYDLTTDELTEVGVASGSTGGFVIRNGLMTIGDQVVISRYDPDLGHELYIYDETSNVSNTDLVDHINIEYSGQNILTIMNSSDAVNIQILNTTGQLINSVTIDSGLSQIDISQNPTGMYFIKAKNNRTLRYLKL